MQYNKIILMVFFDIELAIIMQSNTPIKHF